MLGRQTSDCEIVEVVVVVVGLEHDIYGWQLLERDPWWHVAPRTGELDG
jgi:hypothetical protein